MQFYCICTWNVYCLGISERAYCKACRIELKPHKSVLKTHENTPSHKAKCDKSGHDNINKHFKKVETPATKKAELLLTAQNVMHGASFLSINHLTDIVKDQGKGSILQDIRLQRAKASSLAKNVIGPGIKDTIQDQMVGQKYSVLIDESTDVSSEKLLAVCVRYFSSAAEKVNMSIEFV